MMHCLLRLLDIKHPRLLFNENIITKILKIISIVVVKIINILTVAVRHDFLYV